MIYIESNIAAPVLINLLNLLRKSDIMLGKPCYLSLFPTCLINELRHEISNNVVCATSKGSDQPAHTHTHLQHFSLHQAQ